MQPHTHGPDGSFIPLGEPEPETVVVEAESTAAADVEIAAITAERDVEIAKIDVEREQVWQEGRVAQLEGELRGIRETLDKLTAPAEPEPAPVLIAPPAEPEEELAPAPEPDQPAEPPAEPKKSKGYWGPAYG